MSCDELQEIRAKFRSGETLSNSDRVHLKRLIQQSGEVGPVSEAIYIFAYSFKYDAELAVLLRGIILFDRTPELAAKAIGALSYYWDVLDEGLVDAFLYYLDEMRYEMYFDECQEIERVYRSNKGKEIVERLRAPLENFVSWARSEGFDFN